MNTRISWGLIGTVLVAMAGLLLIRMVPMFQSIQTQRYLAYNDVLGSEVLAHNLPFTLNFKQQNRLIALINQSIPINKIPSPVTQQPQAVTKITLYRFGSTPIELEPAFLIGQDLVYTARLWNSNGYLRDQSGGELANLLSKTYDP
jgi:hypothetical protein